jgi:hypothetical protein
MEQTTKPVGTSGVNLVIQLKGNSGSGKTTVTRQFMAMGRVSKIETVWHSPNAWPKPRHTDYRVQIDGCRRPWVVLGTYLNVCGGADKIKSSAEVIERIEYYTGEGYNVWFEGLLLSTTYGVVGTYLEKFGDDALFAYLDTPLDTCLNRIRARRDTEGNGKPFNPAKTIKRHRAVTILNRDTTEVKHGRRCLTISDSDALSQLWPIILAES